MHPLMRPSFFNQTLSHPHTNPTPHHTMTQPMTTTAAIALITGTGSITDPRLGCLGAQDLAAVRTIIGAFKAQRAALRRIAKAARHTGKVAGTLDGFQFGDTPRVFTEDDAGDLACTADILSDDMMVITNMAVAAIAK